MKSKEKNYPKAKSVTLYPWDKEWNIDETQGKTYRVHSLIHCESRGWEYLLANEKGQPFSTCYAPPEKKNGLYKTGGKIQKYHW
jgi:hypothetical protein